MIELQNHSELFYAYKKELFSLYFLGILGIFLIVLSIYEFKSGRAWEKWVGWVKRADQPWRFWANVIGVILAGIGAICYSIYRLTQLTPP